MDASPFLVRHSEIETSSTYFHRFVSGVGIDKSLIMMRNKIGPSLVPWGTPELTGSQSEKSLKICNLHILQNFVQISLSLFSFLRKMNIPAYTSPTLCIGRTFDAETSNAGSDLFPYDIPTKTININKFSFKYKVVKNGKDGQYINETKKQEEQQEQPC